MTNKTVAVWDVHLADNDWYYVFADSAKQALNIVYETHYDDLVKEEFKQTYKPTVRKISDEEMIQVLDEDDGEIVKTAREWASGNKPEPFCSNTYFV